MKNKLVKLLAFLGFYPNKLKIHGAIYTGVKSSRVLQEFYFNKNHEIEMFILIQAIRYDTMIDIGAYFGYFSIHFCRSNDNAKAVAFEADPEIFCKLKHHIRSNNANVVAYNQAVGDVAAQVEFFKPVYHGTTKYPAHGQVTDPSNNSDGLYFGKKYKNFLVEMVPISDVLKLHANNSTLLKIDIEGYEEKALRSIETILRERNDIDLIVEFLINNSNSNEVFNLLRKCGYSGYLLTNAGLIATDRPLVLPKANQNPQEGKLRTAWENHFFTKRPHIEIKKLNREYFRYDI